MEGGEFRLKREKASLMSKLPAKRLETDEYSKSVLYMSF